MIFKILISTFGFVGTTTVNAAEARLSQDAQIVADPNTFIKEKPDYKYALTTNPALVVNAFPLIGGKGLVLGGEAVLNQKNLIHGTVGYSVQSLESINRLGQRENDDEKTREENKTRLMLYKSKTYYASFGTKYFFNEGFASWFVGSQIKYERERTTVSYNEAYATIESTTFGPGAFGGYRWLWRNGGFIELSGGANVPLYYKDRFNWDGGDPKDREEGEKKYQNFLSFFGPGKAAVPESNLAMGYLFK